MVIKKCFWIVILPRGAVELMSNEDDALLRLYRIRFPATLQRVLLNSKARRLMGVKAQGYHTMKALYYRLHCCACWITFA